MSTKLNFKQKIESKYKNFVNKLFKDTNTSMTNKLALLCTVFSIVNCIILVLISFEADFKPVITLCILSMLLMIFISVYLTIYTNKTVLAANLNLIFLSLIYLPIMWIYTGGINGSASLILFMLIIFNAILNHGKTRFYIALSQFITILVLFYIEVTYPDHITRIPMAPEGQLGVMLNMFYILFSTTLVTAYFIDQYKSSVYKLQQANQNLKQAAQFRRDLTANISHDLNTPITMICGYAEAINDGLLNKEQTEKYLNLIQQKSMDLSGLIDDLLHLTKLENRQLELDFNPIQLVDLIEEQEVRYIYDIQHKGLNFLVKHLPQKLKNAVINIDANQISKVFSNIIYNAMKFTETGSITLACGYDENKVIIAITDTGIGIEKENLPFIFQRFYKGSQSRNSKLKGSGLGLNIAQHIVELHGGEIWVESEIDVGSTFYFSLPLEEI